MMENKKTNKDLLIEAQKIVDEINIKKQEVELSLNIIDKLEIDYYKIVEQVKKQSNGR